MITFEALYYNYWSIVSKKKIDFYHCRHMINHESTNTIVLMSSRKASCNLSATGLGSVVLDECKEKTSMDSEEPQNKIVA